MNKKSYKIIEAAEDSSPAFKSYSINEIMAAGGAMAFANKLGKKPQNILERLKALPKDAFLTEEEFEQAMKTLNESK
jgi:hypothetical protein